MKIKMKNSHQLSRRDWFRLKLPRQPSMLDDPKNELSLEREPDSPLSSATEDGSPAACDSGMKPIDLPPNHDGLDLSKLPPMREATISSEQVAALFSDIEQLATDVLLMQRTRGSHQRAETSKADTPSKLGLAQNALLEGAISRLQVRYRWQNQLWIDTLKRESDGFHIVRIAHQSI